MNKTKLQRVTNVCAESTAGHVALGSHCVNCGGI